MRNQAISVEEEKNRLLSALIPNPGASEGLSRNSFEIVVFSPRPAKQESRPYQPDSPVISARQEVVFGK